MKLSKSGRYVKDQWNEGQYSHQAVRVSETIQAGDVGQWI